MTRGDLRTVILIVCTAIISSVGTAIVAHLLTPHHDRTHELEARVTTLETRPLPPLPAPPPPPPEVIAPPSDPTPCDEVACVLNNYEPACCAQYRKPHLDPDDSLDRTMISAGVSDIKPRIAACGEHSSAKGRVKVSVKVAPDGSVTSVIVRDTPDDRLGACVAAEMKRAHFAKTKLGGSFGYPFIF